MLKFEGNRSSNSNGFKRGKNGFGKIRFKFGWAEINNRRIFVAVTVIIIQILKNYFGAVF